MQAPGALGLRCAVGVRERGWFKKHPAALKTVLFLVFYYYYLKKEEEKENSYTLKKESPPPCATRTSGIRINLRTVPKAYRKARFSSIRNVIGRGCDRVEGFEIDLKKKKVTETP